MAKNKKAKFDKNRLMKRLAEISKSGRQDVNMAKFIFEDRKRY